MCGLAGFIERQGRVPDPQRLRAATSCIAHRGPDDDGHQIVGRVALGHRRLSIVDLSPQGHQPMTGPDDSTWIVFNGEIYNHDALRPGLSAAPYRGHSDTEVLARAMAERGPSCVAGLNGIFAFAALDCRRRVVTLARDHFGIKPLYFARDDDRFYFASEVKSILAAGFRPALNRLAPLDLAFTGWTGDEHTFFGGVRRLPPGSILEYDLDTDQFRLSTYYTPRGDPDLRARTGESEAAWRDALEAQIERSVKAQLMSDVPVGTLCSGGVDSSLITALAARHDPDLVAFNVTCPDAPEQDEGPFARAVAEHLRIPLHSLALTRDAFRRSLVQTVWTTETPLSFVHTVALSLVCQLARDKGVKVLMAGEGADEILGGYVNQFRGLALRMVAEKYGPIGRTAYALADRLNRRLAPRFDWRSPPSPTSFGMHDLLIGSARRAIARRRAEADSAWISEPLERELSAELISQLQSYILPILHRMDRASMSASVEARVPFLDPDLVRLGLSMPARHKVGVRAGRPQGKHLLKQIAAKHVPGWILYRGKMGFTIPPAYYLGPWPRPWLEEGFLVRDYGIDRAHLDAFIDTDRSQSAAWMLTLEIWGQLFMRGRPVADVSAEYLSTP